jgi:hypothetical protein
VANIDLVMRSGLCRVEQHQSTVFMRSFDNGFNRQGHSIQMEE